MDLTACLKSSAILCFVIVALVVIPSHSRHHGRRHKRQHGANLYLPSTYIVPGGEGDSSQWGDWGSPSECSRSCGGGVASQTRECLAHNGRCLGGNRKYFSCNTQDCPESDGDFRLKQCASFNDKLFDNTTYNWVPYLRAPNPCELQCMPKGHRFYYRHKAKVIDGTRCSAESPDVCVDGKCQTVGCDLMLGSDAKEDKCKQCAGDGTTCKTVSGRLDMNNMQHGYNDMLLVPSGATNIQINEVSPSNNYLAIRNLSGSYYLNGDWRIDVPGELSFAGGIWHYDRQPQGFAAPDHITCQGPTTEPIYLVLLYQAPNVGIEYEYSVPEINAHHTEKSIYAWTFKPFSECSQECGGGTQTREVLCVSQTTLAEANPNLCDAILKPVEEQACNQDKCPARWVEGDYGKCSEPCGENGNQTRTVKCERVVAANVSQLVDDKLCLEGVGSKPATVSPCNVGIVCAQWHVGPWQACSQLCGDGVQKRQVQCYRKEGKQVTRLPDEECIEEKPEVEQKCVLRPCEGVDWIVSSWSSCKPCGLTQEARTLACAAKNGKIFNDSFCANHKLPETRRTCESSTICQYQWFKSQWSKCSAECGAGIQTRHVMCGTFDGTAVQKADNETECGDTEKPIDTKDCEGAKSDCMGQWFSGPWTTCSKKCGGGERTRKVLCLVDGLAVKDTHCSEDTIEFSSEVCNKEPCSEDETLPVDVTSKPIVEEDDVGEEWCAEGEESVEGDDLETIDFDDDSGLDAAAFDSDDNELMFSDGTELPQAVSDSLTDGSGDFTADLFSSDASGSGDTEITVAVSSSSSITEASSNDDQTDQTTVSSSDSTTVSSSDSTAVSSSDSTAVSSSDSTAVSSSDSTTVSSFDATTDSSASTFDSTSKSTDDASESTTQFTVDSSDSTTGSVDASSGTTESVTESSDTSSGSTESATSLESSSSSVDQSTSEQSTEQSSSTSDDSSTTTEDSSSSTSESTTSVSETSTDDSTATTVDGTTITEDSSSGSTESSTLVSETSTDGSTGTTDDATTQTIDGSESTTLSSEESTTNADSTTTDDSTTVSGTTNDDTTVSTSSDSTANTESSTSFASTDATATESSDSSTVSSADSTTDSFTATSDISSDITTESTVDVSTVTSGSDQTTVEPWSTSDSDDESTDSSVINAANTTPNTLSTIIKLEQKPRKCRKRPTTKPCIFSDFGCCAVDSKTAATGPFDEGCPTPKTCSETPFGCCSDGLTPAAGKKNKGCPEAPCAGSLFGCCSDGLTEATNAEYEGCPVPEPTTTIGGCAASKFGCCEDGVAEASGPKQAGCQIEATTLYPESTDDSTDEPSEGESTTTDDSVDVPPTTETQMDCTLSKYGCCPDGISEATGEHFHGCDIPTTAECQQSVFGCCKDNRTAATGADFQGCAACLLETFGCCDDGKTPAHGVNREGCCLSSAFGCCPNNINEAQGPNLEGCGCEISTYGCCPDNKTAATGYDNQGCDCKYTQFGCCLDHVTPAQGPQHQGCPCETFQFGCCPDGVTIPTGPHNYGCHCSQTKYKCCTDEKTIASGPNFEGCTCEHSKYGCCPDGQTEAAGNKFEGCVDVPVSPQKACSLTKDMGNCSNYAIKYFFDTEYGACSRFWYGGCEGNDNRFDDAADCKKTCEEPVGKAACALPKVHGPCSGYYPTYYYNSESNSCSQFVYGGCLGNNNRFETLEACQGMCVVNRNAPPCEQEVEAGPCSGSFENWYFDKEVSECRPFIYGGCKGNANRFPTEHACKYQCQRPGTQQPSCALPKQTGQCGEQLARWHYSESTHKCMPFYYSGCDGNSNSYGSLEQCEQQCPRIVEKELCELPAEIGTLQEGDEYLTRWYYDTKDSKCRLFYYGGSAGNANNFQSEEACLSRCGHHVQPTQPPVEERPQPQQPAQPAQTAQPAQPSGSQGHCLLEPDAGECRVAEPRFFYNRENGACERFTYGGCGGNENNFHTDTECQQSCANVHDTCSLPATVGECEHNITKWYFDSSAQRCAEFTYGGCYGNPNNFETETECRERCQPDNTVENRFGEEEPQSVCTEPLELGNCHDDVLSYFFNTESGSCEAFQYTGCEGNGNRFETLEQCERQCGSSKGVDVCHQKADVGPCNSWQTKYYYNTTTRTCEAFTYGGCKGTGNRFSTVSDCQSVCIIREEPVRRANEKAICMLPVESGHCHDTSDTYKRWYYDDSLGTCASFIFVGCAGNQNNFHSFEGCMNYCVKTPVTQAPPKESDPCQAHVDECNTLHCPYGITRSYDEQNCERCVCDQIDPCQYHSCSEDSKCVIEQQRGENGETESVPVCRQINKPGVCPQISNYTSASCDRECDTDADCRNTSKCCEVGCSNLCVTPAAESVTVAPTERPAIHYPGAKAPALEEKSQEELDVVQPEGQVATLRCYATGYPLPTVTWRFGAIVLNTNQGRYVLSSTGDLQIVQVHQSDSGTYICVASNEVGAPVERKVELKIAAPVETNSYIVSPANVTQLVELNQPVTMRCLAGGYPKPSVSWWKGDVMLPISDDQYELNSDFSMTIHRVRLQDLGEYLCQAYSYVGKASAIHTTLKAYGPVHTNNPADQPFLTYLIDRPVVPTTPRPNPNYPYRPVRPPPRYIPVPVVTVQEDHVPVSTNIVLPNGNTFAVGSVVTLQCDVKGYPKPEVAWSKDGVQLQSSDHIQIYDSNRLIISGATSADTGYYKCSARNEFSTSHHAEQINIDGIYVPEGCIDNPFYANCNLIVRGKYCANKYYAGFCCKSCTLAGALRH